MSRSIRHSISFAFAGALAAWAVVAPCAHAAWTPGGVQLSAATGSQADPIVASDGAGGAYVLWSDPRSGNVDLYAQHVLGDGSIAPGWPADGYAVCDLPSLPNGPVLCADGQNGAYVAWSDPRAGTADIYVLRLASGGKAAGWPDDGLLVCGAVSSQSAPAIAPDAAGNLLVAWADVRGTSSDIYAMRVLGNAVVDPAWTVNGNLVCNAARAQAAPALCADGAGGAVIAWADGRNGSTLTPDWDIYAMRISSAGVVDPTWTANGEPVCVQATADQQNTVVLADATGGAFIVWTDGRNGPRASQTQDLFGARLNGHGDLAAGWTANGSVITDAPGQQNSPQLATDNAGGLFVAWADGRDTTTFPTNADVYALRLNGAGAIAAGWTADGTNLTPISPTRQEDPSVAPDASNGLYVAWEDGREGGRVFLKRVNGDASVAAGWPALGLELSATQWPQLNTSLAPDGAGGVVMAWEDPRVAFNDRNIFAQRVSSNGQIGPVVGVPPETARPGIRLALRGAHPVVGRAQWALELDEATSFSASIYGPAGRRVWSTAETAVTNKMQAHTLSWTGQDDLGRRVPPGVYWLRVIAGPQSVAMRFVYLP